MLDIVGAELALGTPTLIASKVANKFFLIIDSVFPSELITCAFFSGYKRTRSFLSVVNTFLSIAANDNKESNYLSGDLGLNFANVITCHANQH